MLPNCLLHIDEADLVKIKRKQASITKLFPKFPARVRKVQQNGGIQDSAYLTAVDPEVWRFKVASGTTLGKSYEIFVKFIKIKPWIHSLTQDKRYWKKGTNEPDLNKIASTIINRADLKLVCSCPAFQYWGPAYIMSLAKYKVKYGDQERRPPRIRNPRQYGAVCKHTHLVLKELPLMVNKFVDFLKAYYKDDIDKYHRQLVNKELKMKREKEKRDKEAKRSLRMWKKAKTKAEAEGEEDVGESKVKIRHRTGSQYYNLSPQAEQLSKDDRWIYIDDLLVVGQGNRKAAFSYTNNARKEGAAEEINKLFKEYGIPATAYTITSRSQFRSSNGLAVVSDDAGDPTEFLEALTDNEYSEENEYIIGKWLGYPKNSTDDLVRYTKDFRKSNETTTASAIAFVPSHFGQTTKATMNYNKLGKKHRKKNDKRRNK